MDWGAVAAMITATAGSATVIGALYRWSRAQGRADALADQAKATITAKDVEIHELEDENRKLWGVLESLTAPKEGR